MPPTSLRCPEEADWIRYESDIREMYVVQRKPLKELIAEMSRRGYRVTWVALPT